MSEAKNEGLEGYEFGVICALRILVEVQNEAKKLRFPREARLLDCLIQDIQNETGVELYD